MVRWVLVSLVSALVLAPSAHATSPYARATVADCDREAREATFEGRMLSHRRAAKMQLRFTLQARTPEDLRFRKIAAPGFGSWITVPPGLVKYTYDKTVQDLLAPARYRVTIDFRWRDRRGKTVRTERSTSPACSLPDTRPDLVVRSVRIEGGDYVAVVFNRGRTAAGPFGVGFLVDGAPAGVAEAARLEPRTTTTVRLRPVACAAGVTVEAVADPRSDVEEANEENNTAVVGC